MSDAQTLSVLLDEELLTLTRVVGMLRRRNLPISSIAVGPSGLPGCARLTVMLQTDGAAADQVARQLDNVTGVRDATVFPARDGIARELALVRLRAPQERYGELLDIALLYKATIIEDASDAVVLEVSGSEAFVLSFFRAIDRFEVLNVARSGAVALERASEPGAEVTFTSETVS